MVIRNDCWKNRELSVGYINPLDKIALANSANNVEKVAGLSSNDLFNCGTPNRIRTAPHT